ncbi:AraC family transcriptional regulator [Paenibacillus solisilvae]|uniref:AraC family transcriptional regulator n=1 Tax=Paenibacillus solisilvae TaxID=2486751 RepID=A0ABW0W4Z0_9BACL
MIFNFQNMTSTLQIVGCHFGIKPDNWTYPKHHHHLYELLCCMEGKAVQDINGAMVEMNPGDWFLIKPGVAHSVANVSDSHYGFFNIHFDLDDLDARNRLGTAPYRLIPSELAKESILPKVIPELERLMQQGLLTGEPSKNPESRIISLALHQRLALQAYVLLIIQEIIQLSEIHSPIHTIAQHQISAYEVDIAHAFEERLTVDLTVNPSISAIAGELNISRSQLSKIFSKVYGLSPRQYLSRRKWSKAKELLATSNLTVYTIAEQLGFRSVNHFSRQFRRWIGMSPNQYRHSMPSL